MIDKLRTGLVSLVCALALVGALWLALSWASSRNPGASSTSPSETLRDATANSELVDTAPAGGVRSPGGVEPTAVPRTEAGRPERGRPVPQPSDARPTTT